MYVTAVSAINPGTNNYKPQFQAKFSEAQINMLLTNAKRVEGVYGMPQLYTLLEYMSSLPGNVAKIVTRKDCKMLTIDGKKVFSADDYLNNFSVLKAFLTGERSPKDTFIKMSPRIFEDLCWKKRACNERSILRFALPKKQVTPRIKPNKPVKFDVTPPKPKFAALIDNIENFKPYSVVKEIYKNKRGQYVTISNIEILSKSKTAEGIAELDAMEMNMNKTFRPIFNQRRAAIVLEIEKQNQRPEIYGKK